jgi:methionyl-tRNA synthetase
MTGSKISTSRNFAIWAPDILERFDPDPVRYYLNAVAPESRDSDFTFEDFIRRNNDELVATWGNLVNRMLGFAYKRFDGVVPQPGQLDTEDEAILTTIAAGFDEVGQLLEAAKFKAAQQAAMKLAQAANIYLDKKEPWKTIKVNKEATATSVYVILRVINDLKIIFAPFLPFTSQKLHEYLGFEGTLFGEIYQQEFTEAESSHVALCTGPGGIGRWQPGELSPGQALQKPGPLFKKLEPEVAEQELARLLGTA